jgi:hypothetical protein
MSLIMPDVPRCFPSIHNIYVARVLSHDRIKLSSLLSSHVFQPEFEAHNEDRMSSSQNSCRTHRRYTAPKEPSFGVPVCSYIDFNLDAGPQYPRNSFYAITRLFGPTMHTVFMIRRRERARHLAAEAKKATIARMADRGPDPRIELSIQLELQTLLCMEYR